MEPLNDWDLQAVVRSCGTAACSSSSAAVESLHKEAARSMVEAGSESFLGQPAATLRDLDSLNLDHELPFSITPASDGRANDDQEVLISSPAESASGQSRKKAGRRKPGVRAPRPKRSKKSQHKKVLCEVPVADGGVSTDLWAWRKYGQKPIKGSPYPRGYYKCSSLKACLARKLVERNPEKPEVLTITYIAEHCHAVPTMLNSVAGTTRNRPPSPVPDRRSQSDEPSATNNRREDSADASSITADGGSAGTPDDENVDLWPVDMSLLDEYPLDDLLGPFADGVDLCLEDVDERDGFGRRMSL